MTRKKPVYTREFKMAILAQVNSGIPVPQVARENGLHPSLVFRWRQLYLEDPETAFAGPGNPYKEHARIAELERTVGRLYSENEFLKKTLETLKTRVSEEKRKSQLRSDSK
jgi:transposase-like protein